MLSEFVKIEKLCFLIIDLILVNATLYFYKNVFYKNAEAEINQIFKNLLRTFIPQAESRLRMFLFC